ncbi:MAG: hypothetical protein LBU87_01130 [Lactobacillales bacterium]|jgi:hypothetical protein|nr:hypothetical protein [Lactobacillales bacterium]
MAQIEQEKRFHIFKNDDNELMFLIQARLSNAEKPEIVYDGSDNALFYRNSKNTILLPNIHPQVQSVLADKKDVLVVEAQGGAIMREYMATVKRIKELPTLKNIKKI